MHCSKFRSILVDNKTGRWKKEGDKIVRPELANFLRLVAQEGVGQPSLKVLKAMADDLAEMGSIITLNDLLNYHPMWRTPIRMQIRRGPIANAKTDFELHAAPPPSSGVLVGLALNMLAKYNYASENVKLCERGYLYYHRLLETFKFAFAKRSHLSDEAFLSENAKKLLKQLQTLQFADKLQSMIVDEYTQDINYYGSVWSTGNQEGTSHISILADNGDAVAVTSTINTKFGSKMMGRRTGVLFNNEMDDFSSPNTSDYFGLAPAEENFIRPGKRPLSSMSPVIFTHPTNGSVRLVIGASGGSLILTSVINSALNDLYFNLDVKKAIDDPRVHHQLLPNHILPDANFPKDVLEQLKKLGHKVAPPGLFASVQGIEVIATKDTRANQLRANADYRKGGETDGL